MTKYLLRYTTAQGVQFIQEFPDSESRENAFKLIGSTQRIYSPGCVVRITENIVCVEAINDNVENTVEDLVKNED